MTGTEAQVTAPSVHLPDVTLVAVTSVAIAATARALKLSLEACSFGSALFLSDQDPARFLGSAGQAIEWRSIPALQSREDYSQFMLSQLHEHIATSHALCIQWDGYVLRPDAWQTEFLMYDYIGAPWPHFDDDMKVGNGGFSLRSRRLLKATADLNAAADLPEDITICRKHRRYLEQTNAIRFAPDDLARSFAYERTRPSGLEFGFHGVFNLARLISKGELQELLTALEPKLIARPEHWELLRLALRRAQPRIALTLARRLLSARR